MLSDSLTIEHEHLTSRNHLEKPISSLACTHHWMACSFGHLSWWWTFVVSMCVLTWWLWLDGVHEYIFRFHVCLCHDRIWQRQWMWGIGYAKESTFTHDSALWTTWIEKAMNDQRMMEKFVRWFKSETRLALATSLSVRSWIYIMIFRASFQKCNDKVQ